MRLQRRILRLAALAAISAPLLAGCGPRTPDAFVASAKDYLAKNDRNSAVVQLKSALQKNPDYAEARFLLGKALLETGDVLGAEKELRRAAELQYPVDQVAPLLARAMFLRGAAGKVVEEFGKVEIKAPQNKAELQTTLGLSYLGLGNKDAARSAFATALATVPDFPSALLGQSWMKAVEGDLPGALALTDKAISKAPKLVDGWQMQGDILSALGRTDEALIAYRKALEVRPNFLPAQARIVALLLKMDKVDEAAKELATIQKLAPKSLQTYYLQALVAVRQRNFTAAQEASQQFLRLAPDNALGILLNARSALELGSYASAEASAQKVLQRHPTQKYPRLLLANVYIKTGQPVRALDAIRPLLDAGEEDSDVLSLAGEIYMLNGDNAQAARYFTRASELDPKNSEKRVSVAIMRFASGDSEAGLHDLQDIAATETGIRAQLAVVAVAMRAGKFDVALGAIDEIEKKQPKAALPHDLRGSVLAAKGDRAGARKSFERALSLDPRDFSAVSGLAKLDLEDKQPAQAKQRYEALLAKDPKNSRAILAVADLNAHSGGKPDEVAAMIGKAVAADPTSTAPRLALITYYINVQQPKKAVAAAQDALAAIPDRAELLYAAGQAQTAAGEPNQAAKTYSKLAAITPGSSMPYFREAQTEIAAKDWDAALASLKKALAVKPDFLEAQRALIGVYLATNRTAEALAVAREVQKQRPKETAGFVFEGEIHAGKKAWKDAIATYRKGLAVQPDSGDLAARTYVALRGSGNNADADKLAATWVRDHPKDIAFRTFIAESLMVRGDLQAAARQYTTLLEQQPNDALALNNLAWIMGQLKDPKAIEFAQKADQLVPNNPAILDTLGVLQTDAGDAKKGVETLQRASALAPNAYGVRLHLARALIKDGQKDAAKKELETLAKLGDKFAGQAEVTKLMQGL